MKEVGPGVWMRVAVTISLGAIWASIGGGVLSSMRSKTRRRPMWCAASSSKPPAELKYVVTTHWDTDHIACNPQWRREGATVIAHKLCAERRAMGRPPRYFLPRQSDPARPSDKAIEMRWVGGTHTPWDTLLYFPHARVLHIADLFGWGLIPCQPTPHKNRSSARRSTTNLLSTTSGCPGRGQVATREEPDSLPLVLRRDAGESARAHRGRQEQQGNPDKISEPTDMADWWRFNDWKHAKNVALIHKLRAISPQFTGQKASAPKRSLYCSGVLPAFHICGIRCSVEEIVFGEHYAVKRTHNNHTLNFRS